jgi:hypothetical protein
MKQASMCCMVTLALLTYGCASKVGYTVRNETERPIHVVIGQYHDPSADSDNVASATVAIGESFAFGGDSRGFRRHPIIFIGVEGSEDDPIELKAPMDGGWFYRVQNLSGVIHVTTQKIIPRPSD